jgi:hypothetical protein
VEKRGALETLDAKQRVHERYVIFRTSNVPVTHHRREEGARAVRFQHFILVILAFDGTFLLFCG